MHMYMTSIHDKEGMNLQIIRPLNWCIIASGDTINNYVITIVYIIYIIIIL